MAVPDVDEFNLAIALTRESFASEVIETMRSIVLRPIDDNSRVLLIEALEEYERLRNLQWDRLESSSVHRWLVSQSGFKAAHALCWTGRRKGVRSETGSTLTLSEVAERMVQRPNLIDRILDDSFSKLWISRYVAALHEYYYTSNAETLQTASKRLDEMKIQIGKIGDELGVLSEVLTQRVGASRFAWRILDQIDVLRTHSMLQTFTRDNKYKKERLLAKRLFNAHMDRFKAWKVEAIAEMLTTEGIENQVDLRTIHRWCKTFSARVRAVPSSKSG